MNKAIIFLLGAGVGSTVTYFLVKEKYKRIANEEIESVVKTFKTRFDSLKKELDEPIKGPETPEEMEKKPYPKDEVKEEIKENYKEEVENLGYSVGVDLSEGKDMHVENTVINNKGKLAPYVISEEEFGEFGNDEETLYFYADHVLADDNDEIIVDPEALIGDTLTQFGDQDETMYVRNEEREIDYIILRSEKFYKDIAPEVDD